MGGDAAIGRWVCHITMVTIIHAHSTYNYAGKLYNRLIGAMNKGDLITAQLEQVLCYHGDVFICSVVIETSSVDGVHYIEIWTW